MQEKTCSSFHYLTGQGNLDRDDSQESDQIDRDEEMTTFGHTFTHLKTYALDINGFSKRSFIRTSSTRKSRAHSRGSA